MVWSKWERHQTFPVCSGPPRSGDLPLSGGHVTTSDKIPQSSADRAPDTAPVPEAIHHHSLKVGAIGLAGVLFMAVANAAPITAMTGNVPIALGYGNGIGAPAGFLVATIVLTLFTVGFVRWLATSRRP